VFSIKYKYVKSFCQLISLCYIFCNLKWRICHLCLLFSQWRISLFVFNLRLIIIYILIIAFRIVCWKRSLIRLMINILSGIPQLIFLLNLWSILLFGLLFNLLVWIILLLLFIHYIVYRIFFILLLHRDKSCFLLTGWIISLLTL